MARTQKKSSPSIVKDKGLKIDVEQLNRHLELLGYEANDELFFRSIPNQQGVGGVQKFSQIPAKQHEKVGLYLVVNGQGHDDRHVTQGRALFYEYDDIPLEDQLLSWQSKGLPEPTFQVKTRKSIHTYYVFTEPIPIAQWQVLQKDLLSLMDGCDKAIKNPSRVMRLAGTWHTKEQPILCEIISDSSKRYLYEELRAKIKTAGDFEARKAEFRPSYEKFTANFTMPYEGEVPLTICLTRSDRTLLELGESEGVRNDAGFKLAANIIATAKHLDTLSQRYTPIPLTLFQQYAEACQPPLDYREAEAIYRSAEGRTKNPSMTDEAITNCVQAWVWKQIDIGAIEPDSSMCVGSIKPTKDLVEDRTVELHVFERLFDAGKGNWGVIDSDFYWYTGRGYWEKKDTDYIEHVVAKKLSTAYKLKFFAGEAVEVRSFASEQKKQSAVKFCLSLLHQHVDEKLSTLRCFSNCTIDLKTNTQFEHSKKHLMTSFVDAEYHPNAECPQIFLDFIDASYGTNKYLKLIRACTAMLLDPSAPYFRFIHLKGESGSGKGTLLRFWVSMFGENNVNSGNFSVFSEPEKRHQNLSGISLYVIADSDKNTVIPKEFFELVDNGPMSGRTLFKSSTYSKRWNVRFVVASVEHFHQGNVGDGWARRALILPTKNSKYRDFDIDPRLGEKLEEVKADVISWALSMDKSERDDLIKNAEHLIEDLREEKREAAVTGDPVMSFVDMCLRPSETGKTISSAELHGYYQAFCKTCGYRPKGLNQFAAHLKTVINKNFRPRCRTKISEKKWGWSSASWTNLAIPYSLFDTDLNNTTTFNINDCSEGGLDEIQEFWGLKEKVNECKGGQVYAITQNTYEEAITGDDREEI